MSKSWIGETIGGRYEIDSLLGQGGMSAVYGATDPNLRRMVAIKLIHPHLSVNPNFVNRFKEEAAAVARLRHPNIVQVHDFDVDGETYYMVMEYLAGESLQSHLKRLNAAHRYIPYLKAIQICTQICRALGYAHNHELIHRDIKPANIMLDLHGNAILMDFGIVKIIGGEYHTATGATLGTVMYMSPEQMRSEKVDEQSDIYSLGVTLYEMISGRVPYQADSVPTLMMMALNDPLPDLRESRKGIPQGLLDIVEKALAKEKTDRFQTMEDMAAALERVEKEVEAIVPEETVLDEDEPSPSISPSKRPVAVKETDSKKGEAPSQGVYQEKESTKERHKDKVKRPDLPTVLDAPSKSDAIPKQSAVSRIKGFLTLNRARVVIAIAVVLVIGVAGTFGFIYVQSQEEPTSTIIPIDQPAIPINAETANLIVNLGRWDTDSVISAQEFSPDGTLIGTANHRNTRVNSPYRYYSALWQVKTGSLQQYQLDHSDWVYSVAFSSDGQYFATASDDDTIMVWGIPEGTLVRTIEALLGGIQTVDFSPSNLLLAAGSGDGVVGLWQVSDGQLLRKLEGHENSVTEVAFSPDGDLIASASDDHTVLLWRVSDGSLVYTLEGHTASIRAISFSPDGNWLASASEDHSIGLWNVSDGSLNKSLRGNTDVVVDIVFSTDSTLLVSGADDGKVVLWRASDGELLRTLEEHSDSITGIAFSPDSTLLAAGAADGAVLFWGLSEAIQVETTPTVSDP
jgi:serine/threonine protein kinase